jgi:hypothetical protein
MGDDEILPCCCMAGFSGNSFRHFGVKMGPQHHRQSYKEENRVGKYRLYLKIVQMIEFEEEKTTLDHSMEFIPKGL